MLKKLLTIALFLVFASVLFADVADNYVPVEYSCDGSATEFTFSWSIDETSDLEVILKLTATEAETVLTENNQYTVSATNNDYSNGGTVTTTTAYANTYTLTIRRATPKTQDTNLVDTGTLRVAALEDGLDKLTRLVQDLSEEVNRCIQIPKTEITTVDLVSARNRADKNLTFDANGGVTATTLLSTGTANISAFGETLIDDANANEAMTTLNGIPVFNIRTYGATGDGTTDDQSAIQAAVTAAAANLGGTVYFPKGTYMVKTTVVIPSTGGMIRLEGAGAASLQALGTYVPSAEIVTDQAIYCLTIGETGNVFHAGPVIENLGFADTSGSYDQASGGIYNFQASHTRIMNCSFRNFTVGTGIYYDQDETAIYNTIYHPIIRNCKYGIYTGRSTSLLVYGGQINGNNIANGIGVWAEKATNNLTLFNVGFDGCVTGIELGALGVVPICTNIVNCRLESCTLAVDIVNSEAGLMTGCFFHSGNTDHWTMQDGANCRHWKIFHNNYAGTDADLAAKITISKDELTGSDRNYFNEPDLNLYENPIVGNTFTDGDTTPNVDFCDYFATANTSATSITDFDGNRVYSGKIIHIWVNDTYTTFVHSTNLKIAGGIDYTPDDDEMMVFYREPSRWVEISRSNLRGAVVTDAVSLTAAEIKLLAGTPKELVAAQGANTLIEFISATLVLNYGSEVLAEPSAPDDLAIEYNNGTGTQIATWDTTGFITSNADAMQIVNAASVGGGASAIAATTNGNKNIALINTGGDYTGNASGDTTMTVYVSYRLHTNTVF